jgi:hypothetical protein
MDLRAAVAEMQAFIADEAAANRAMLLEPDDEAYRAADERAQAHLSDGVSLGFGREPGRGPVATDADQREYAEGLGPRVLFAVTRHERGGRPVFRAYTSSPSATSGYGIAFNLAEVGGKLKIVGRASSDRRGPPSALTWRPLDGDQLDDAGPPLEALKLQRPRHAASAAHYDSLPGSEDRQQ